MPDLNIPAPSEKQRRFFADRHKYVAYGGARGGGRPPFHASVSTGSQ